MVRLVSLPAVVLVLASVALAVAVAFASRWLTRVVVPEAEHDHVQPVASPLMPALGATFAILMALTLANEATYLRSAQNIVSDEAAEASRLAWASTNPGVDAAAIQAALSEYLQVTRDTEWDGDDDPATAAALAQLEHVVRAEASQPSLGTPPSTELLSSVDGVSTARRDRLAAASHQLPVLYVVTVVASGLALIANAGALVFRRSLRASLLVTGLAVIVALCISLLFALTAPWRGAIDVSGGPIDRVVTDLGAGFFSS